MLCKLSSLFHKVSWIHDVRAALAYISPLTLAWKTNKFLLMITSAFIYQGTIELPSSNLHSKIKIYKLALVQNDKFHRNEAINLSSQPHIHKTLIGSNIVVDPG